MKIYVYRCTDQHGNESVGVVGEPSDTLCLSGLADAMHAPVLFESDAYHAFPWAEENGFRLTRYVVTLDLDRMDCTDWSYDEIGLGAEG